MTADQDRCSWQSALEVFGEDARAGVAQAGRAAGVQCLARDGTRDRAVPVGVRPAVVVVIRGANGRGDVAVDQVALDFRRLILLPARVPS